MEHGYEEIRAAALDVIAGREKGFTYEANQFRYLAIAVAEVLMRREQPEKSRTFPRQPFELSSAESETCLEVFWDLFRQGIITLGLNDMNPQYPFFRVSRLGKTILDHQQAYFFHDVSTYEALIRREVPRIDAVTLLYLKEALQAFRSGCLLSASVMLGVATEHTFNRLVDLTVGSRTHAKIFASVPKERGILNQANKYKRLLDQHVKLPSELKEDVDTRFAGILSIIRTFRNEAGHPTGTIIDREQAYVNLNLFVPYAKKMYQLMEFMRH
jgi:hypothetical protein